MDENLVQVNKNNQNAEAQIQAPVQENAAEQVQAPVQVNGVNQVQVPVQENVAEQVQVQENAAGQIEEQEVVPEEVRLEEERREEAKKKLEESFKKAKVRKLDVRAFEAQSEKRNVTRVVKKRLLKSDITETVEVDYFKGLEQQKDMRADNAETLRATEFASKDVKAEFRMGTDIKVKAGVGFENFRNLSQFYPAFLSAGYTKEDFNGFIVKYGINAEAKGRFEVLDGLTGRIMDINPSEYDFSSDKAIASKGFQLETMSAMVEAYRRLIDDNPDYLESLKEKKAEGGKSSYYEQLMNQLEMVSAMSDYYRIRKLIMSDPEYIECGGDMEQEIKKEDSRSTVHLKSMLRASYHIAKGLNRLFAGAKHELEFPEPEVKGSRSKKYYDSIDGAFAVNKRALRRADIASEYGMQRENLIREEIDRLEREAASVTDVKLRDCIGSLVNPNKPENCLYTKLNAINTNSLNYIIDQEVSKRELKRDGLLKRVKEYILAHSNNIKFENPDIYKDLTGFDGNDAMARMINKICTELGDDLSDNEVMEWIENQYAGNNAEYERKKEEQFIKDNNGFGADALEGMSKEEKTYYEEAYADAVMRNLFRLNAIHEKLDEAIGAKALYMHPADLVASIPDELFSLIIGITTVSNILQREKSYTHVANFIDQYVAKHTRKKMVDGREVSFYTGAYKLDGRRFANSANTYSQINFKFEPISKYFLYLAYMYEKESGNEVEDDDLINAYQMLSGNHIASIPKAKIDECYNEYKNDPKYNKIYDECKLRKSEYTEGVRKVYFYVMVHPEEIKIEEMRKIPGQAYDRTRAEGSQEKELRMARQFGYARLPKTEELKAYEEKLKKNYGKINIDAEGNVIDDDPFWLKGIKEMAHERDDANEAVRNYKAHKFTDILSMNADEFKKEAEKAKLEAKEEKEEKDKYEKGELSYATRSFRVYSDGSTLGVESQKLAKNAGHRMTPEEYEDSFDPEKAFFVLQDGSLFERVIKDAKASAVAKGKEGIDDEFEPLQLLLEDDIRHIERSKAKIEEYGSKCPGFTNYMSDKLETLYDLVDYRAGRKQKLPGVDAKVIDYSGGVMSDDRLELEKRDLYNKDNYFELTGIAHEGKSVLKNGTYAASMAMQFKSRGFDISQEQVNTKLYNLVGNEVTRVEELKLGVDEEKSVLACAGLISFAKDNMAVHSTTADFYGRNKDKLDRIREKIREKLTSSGIEADIATVEIILAKQIESDVDLSRQRKNDIEYIRRCIIDAIAKHKSPVSARFGDHYITIYGVEGNKVKFDDHITSVENPTRIDDLEHLFTGKVELVWFEELKPGVAERDYLKERSGYGDAGNLYGSDIRNYEYNIYGTRYEYKGEKYKDSIVSGMMKDGYIKEGEKVSTEQTIYLPKRVYFKTVEEEKKESEAREKMVRSKKLKKAEKKYSSDLVTGARCIKHTDFKNRTVGRPHEKDEIFSEEKFEELFGRDEVIDRMNENVRFIESSFTDPIPEAEDVKEAPSKEEEEARNTIKKALAKECGILSDQRVKDYEMGRVNMASTTLEHYNKKGGMLRYQEPETKQAMVHLFYFMGINKDYKAFNGSSLVCEDPIAMSSHFDHMLYAGGVFQLDEFDYFSDAQFVSGFAEKYDKLLKISAMKTLAEYVIRKFPDHKHNLYLSTTEAIARLEYFDNVRKHYEDRMKLISSPYYTRVSTQTLQGLAADPGKVEAIRDEGFRNFVKLYKKVQESDFGPEGKDKKPVYERLVDKRLEESYERDMAVLNNIMEGVELKDNMVDTVVTMYNKVKDKTLLALPEDDMVFLKTVRYADTTDRAGALDMDDIANCEKDIEDICEKGEFRGQKLKEEHKAALKADIDSFIANRRRAVAHFEAKYITEGWTHGFYTDINNPKIKNSELGRKLWEKFKTAHNDDLVKIIIDGKKTRNPYMRSLTDIYGKMVAFGYKINEKYESLIGKNLDKAMTLRKKKYGIDSFPVFSVNGRSYKDYKGNYLYDVLSGKNLTIPGRDGERVCELLDEYDELTRTQMSIDFNFGAMGAEGEKYLVGHVYGKQNKKKGFDMEQELFDIVSRYDEDVKTVKNGKYAKFRKKDENKEKLSRKPELEFVQW